MPINAPVRIDGSVGFWFSLNGVSMSFRGCRSMNVSIVSGGASRSVAPMRECRGGPWSVPGRLRNSVMSGCMSGAMLPSNSAGKLT